MGSRRTISGPLGVRNFRLFLSGQVISQCGTQMQTIALAWLVLDLTGSGGDLGLLLFLTYVPALVVGPWGGVIADRLNKRRGVLLIQTLQCVTAALLAVLTISGVIDLWMIYVLAFWNGALTVVDMPLRQVLVHEMVSDVHLRGALGLTTALGYASMTFGPAVAGIVIVSAGVSACFVINAISFVAVIGGLLALHKDEMHVSESVARSKGQIREGIHKVWSTPLLRSTFVMLFLVGTFGFSYNVVLPLMASETFDGGAGSYGLLATCMGVGSVVGSLTGASVHRARPWQLVLVTAAFGVSVLVTSVMPTVATAAVMLVLFGACFAGFVITANLTVQLSVPPNIRGRVMSLYGVLFWCSTALSGLVAGGIAEWLGPRPVFVFDGFAILLTAAAGSVSVRRRLALLGPQPTDESSAFALAVD